MKYIINNHDYSNEVNSLTKFAQKKLGFTNAPKILFDDDLPNSQKTLGKTGYYDPNSSEVHIYASGRHIKDILRSLAHEFVHHMQNEKGDLTHDGYMGQGYAQKNPKMREMERQAYEIGNLCFRDWEDSLKEKHPTIYNERRNRKMSLKDWKNKELNENLNKKWGFNMNLDALNENKKKEYDLEENQDRIFAPSHYCLHHVIHEGKKGYTVDHNYNERLGKVTRYDVKFEDGSIKRNIHESELTALEAFDEGSHGGKAKRDHPKVKEDKNEGKMKGELHKQTLAMMKKHPELSYEEAEEKVYGQKNEGEMPMKDEPEGEDLNDDGKKGHGKVPAFLDEAEDKSEKDEEDKPDEDDSTKGDDESKPSDDKKVHRHDTPDDPQSTKRKEKESGGKEKKDLSKVPPQLRKHVEKSMKESLNRSVRVKVKK